MLKGISRTRLITLWFAIVAVAVAVAVVAGANIGVPTTAFLLALCLVPPAVMLLVWRGAPPPTIGEILYTANNTSSVKGGRS